MRARKDNLSSPGGGAYRTIGNGMARGNVSLDRAISWCFHLLLRLWTAGHRFEETEHSICPELPLESLLVPATFSLTGRLQDKPDTDCQE
jgi:hypothetical protein